MATERPGPSRLLTGAFLAAALVVGGAQQDLACFPLDRIENPTDCAFCRRVPHHRAWALS
jgi:hypothetical protein